MTYTKQHSHRMLSCCLYIYTYIYMHLSHCPTPQNRSVPLLCSKARFEKVNVVSVVTKIANV